MGADLQADKLAIAEVLVRYATGIDRRDWDLFRTCFTADVVAEYQDIATWTDVETMTEWMVGAHAEMGHTMHRVSNIAVEVAGDSATARAYVDAVLMTVDGKSGLQALGLYDDELVRTPAGWRISHRRFTSVHMRPLG